MDIKEKVIFFLNKYNLLQPQTKILAAFSGGYDSLCLLHILKELNAEVTAIHLNHNWRGEESKKDENNCAEFCRKNSICFYSETLNDDYPKTETAARDARYQFFEKCAVKFNAKAVLTAHNANDNAETILYRISKGTGISGLTGIVEHRGIFYRPLLASSRDEIEKYCHKFDLEPNIDSSNDDIKYKRNFIRHKIVPELKNINKSVINALNNLSETASNDNQIIDEYLKSIENPFQTDTFINLSNPVQARLVYNLFLDNNLDYDRTKITRVLNFINQNSNSKSGKKSSLSKDLELFVNNKQIEIIKPSPINKISLKITKEGIYHANTQIFTIKQCSQIPNKFPPDIEMTAYVDLSNFDELTLRQRRDGDYICPLNVNGSQKLKKYLNEKKVPAHKKDELLFLASGQEILWAPGFGINSKVRVVKKATHVLKLEDKQLSLEG